MDERELFHARVALQNLTEHVSQEANNVDIIDENLKECQR